MRLVSGPFSPLVAQWVADQIGHGLDWGPCEAIGVVDKHDNLMTTATQRLQAIQDECKRQGKPTHGTAFLRVAERMNEALRGTGTPAYQHG